VTVQTIATCARGFTLRHRFATQSDPEIGYAWEECGEDALTELRGMFAFALLDLRERYATPRSVLARDPPGIKPLYYTQTAEGFAFASEVSRAFSLWRGAQKHVTGRVTLICFLAASRSH